MQMLEISAAELMMGEGGGWLRDFWNWLQSPQGQTVIGLVGVVLAVVALL
jgi:hypothetical protein